VDHPSFAASVILMTRTGIDVQVMAFPRRAYADPASSWLRTLIAEIADRLPRALGLQARRRIAARRPAIAAR